MISQKKSHLLKIKLIYLQTNNFIFLHFTSKFFFKYVYLNTSLFIPGVKFPADFFFQDFNIDILTMIKCSIISNYRVAARYIEYQNYLNIFDISPNIVKNIEILNFKFFNIEIGKKVGDTFSGNSYLF